MSESGLRERIARVARSMFERRLTFGASGNISVRLDDGWLMTPTGASMGEIDPARISKLDANGQWIDGDKPTKESFLHLAMYGERPKAGAVVHLHSTHSVAVSCLKGIDADDVLPPMTAYYVMRVGQLPLVPYYAPGDADLAMAVRTTASRHHAMLLANHGPVVAGRSLDTASGAIEELEETAKLYLLLKDRDFVPLSTAEVAALRRQFPIDT